MRSTWIVAAALAAVLAGCGSTTPAQPIGFSEPSGVAVFGGLTPKYSSVHPYVAVVNAGRSDLTLLDAWDDTPLLAPVVVRSLAVPVPTVHPTLLVSSALADGTDAVPTPDLLVVAAPTSLVLQLVDTWSGAPQVVDAQAVDLGAVAPGADILALATVPALDPVTGVRLVGQARVVASLTGGRLAVVDYHRTADAKGLAIAPVLDASQKPVVALQPLVAGAGSVPFDAVSLAVNPALPAHLYAASPDPIGGVEGVADLVISGTPGTWGISALNARAPTTVVAAASLRERALDSAADDATAFFTETVNRVYAVLDPARCGPTQRVPCGIAVLNPGTSGMVNDYTLGTSMPYLAPIPVPGVPIALSISLPPRNPPSTSATDAQYAGTLMRIAPPSGVRGTTAVAAVASSDGHVYFVDLGRWAIPNNTSILRSSTRTIVSIAGASVISPSPRQLGLWQVSATGQGTLLKTGLEAAVTVTPGFTTSETWTVSYQGTLPGLELHKGDTGRAPDGSTWVGLQVAAPTPGGGTTFTQVVRLTDPSLGIHVGDVVRLLPTGVPACVDPTPVEDGGTAAAEATVAVILPPTTEYPGGAITLAPTLTDPRYDPTRVVDATHPQIGYDWPACIAALAGGSRGGQVELRAGEFVLVGSVTGYAGRPTVQYAAPGAPSFSFAYANEDTDPSVADCKTEPATCTDATCRPACERLALVRKARRIYHLSDACRTTDIGDDCNRLWPGSQFPRESGPVVAFTLGYIPDPADNGGTVPTTDPKLRALLRAGLKLTFTTASGISPTTFSPGTGSGSAASYPLAATTYDRSVVPGKEGDGYRFYVPYVDAFLLDFSPSEASTAAKILR